MTAPVHFEVEILDGTLFAPLCENNAGVDAFDASDDVEMTDRDEEVTCPACLAALGYAIEPARHVLTARAINEQPRRAA